jgi:hypothetical protein
MIDSKGSVVIGQERALDGLAGSVVVPDGGGQREDALQDADGHALSGVAAVSFQAGLAFEGVDPSPGVRTHANRMFPRITQVGS